MLDIPPLNIANHLNPFNAHFSLHTPCHNETVRQQVSSFVEGGKRRQFASRKHCVYSAHTNQLPLI